MVLAAAAAQPLLTTAPAMAGMVWRRVRGGGGAAVR